MERYQGTGRRDGGRDRKRRESGERERGREGDECAAWSAGDRGSDVFVWGGVK